MAGLQVQAGIQGLSVAFQTEQEGSGLMSRLLGTEGTEGTHQEGVQTQAPQSGGGQLVAQGLEASWSKCVETPVPSQILTSGRVFAPGVSREKVGRREWGTVVGWGTVINRAQGFQ